MNFSSNLNNGLFQVVEIEIGRNCNRRCSYCPQSFDWYRGPEQFMKRSLFESLIDQLKKCKFAGRLSFHHYNEPLLNPELIDLISYARERLPFAWFVLYSNGDLLNQSKYESLQNAGIDFFMITSHSGRKFPQRLYQHVKYPDTFIISSRGSLVHKAKLNYLPCYAPSEMLIIRYDGKVVLCHEDAMSSTVMGDTNKQSIKSIWFSNSFKKYRKKLIRGHRDSTCQLCAKCDNRLHPLPDTAI
jgi:2-deoxy-scyllo-inosamine dehydrogenase (SAM-dependent)